MNIEIIKLTPALAEDYIRFFDETPHWDDIDCHKCYCAGWASCDHKSETEEDGRTAKGRREIAKRYVNEGFIQGYLAYCNEKIVGWCNANTKADCLHSFGWEISMQSVDTGEDKPDIKIKSVFCFVIAPDMQRKGIATKLLEKVCIDAANEGFDFVEAYPKKIFINEAEDFMGPAEMYKKCGFAVHGEMEDMLIMRKELSGQIEAYINKILKEDERKNALDLAAFLSANEMQFERSTTKYWVDKLYWYVKFKDEFVGFILINGYGAVGDETEPEGFIFWSDDYTSDSFANYPLDEHTKEIAYNHVDFGTCGGGVTCKLFGKEFSPVCNGTTFRFNNPDAEGIKCIKKLIELRKSDILKKRAPNMCICIKQLNSSEIISALDIVKKAFDLFIAPDYSNDGINTFYDFIKPENFRSRIDSGNFYIWGAFENNTITGVVAIRDNHISVFSVDPDRHGKGIGRSLMGIAFDHVMGLGLTYVTVNASSYAVPVYQKLGFKCTDTEQIKDGMRYTPMKALLKNDKN